MTNEEEKSNDYIVRKEMITTELNDIILNTQKEEMDDTEDMEPEAVEALRLAAHKLCYTKKYYDVFKDVFVFFPSVYKTIMTYDLMEEAEKHYFEEEDEFPMEYSAALRSYVTNKAANNEAPGVGDDDDDEYMLSLAMDVDTEGPPSDKENDHGVNKTNQHQKEKSPKRADDKDEDYIVDPEIVKMTQLLDDALNGDDDENEEIEFHTPDKGSISRLLDEALDDHHEVEPEASPAKASQPNAKSSVTKTTTSPSEMKKDVSKKMKPRNLFSPKNGTQTKPSPAKVAAKPKPTTRTSNRVSSTRTGPPANKAERTTTTKTKGQQQASTTAAGSISKTSSTTPKKARPMNGTKKGNSISKKTPLSTPKRSTTIPSSRSRSLSRTPRGNPAVARTQNAKGAMDSTGNIATDFVSPRRGDLRTPGTQPLCQLEYQPNLHASRAACELCLHFLSPSERDAFEIRGHHLRVMQTMGGCGRDCCVFPRVKHPDTPAIRLCRSCFANTHDANDNVGIKPVLLKEPPRPLTPSAVRLAAEQSGMRRSRVRSLSPLQKRHFASRAIHKESPMVA